jgi:hypothetical protein
MPVFTEHVQPFLLVVATGIAYLAILRAVDLNEREPLWSLLVLAWAGASAAALVRLLVRSPVLTLDPFRAAIVEETATLGAIVVGFVALAAAGRWKGWSEVSDWMDGLVYGAAAGLGYTLVDALIGLVGRPTGALASARPGALATLWTGALGGLAHGLFGALIGIGCAAFLLHRSAVHAALSTLLGWALAVAAHVGYEILAHGAALSGAPAVARLWVALALPLALVAVLAVRSLRSERRAIRAELAADSVASGTGLLDAGWIGRRRGGLAALLRGDFRAHTHARTLHNRQVQLALARARERRAPDTASRARAEAEVGRLRAAVSALRAEEVR